MEINTTFCELLCAKFCHDLAGPIGAINNGIDFLESNNAEMKKKAFELVASSSKNAINKLTFLRQAYGFIHPDAEVSIANMHALLQNFLNETKIEIEISNTKKERNLEGHLAKLIYNIAIIISAIMMYSGKLKITLGDKVTFTSTAPLHKIEPDIKDIFNNNLSKIELTTRNIQPIFTQTIANNLGYHISLNQSEDQLTVILKK